MRLSNITAVTTKTVNLLVTPIFSLFVVALFVPFATPAGAWIGTASGLVSAFMTAFSGPLFGLDPETGYNPVSFEWIAPVSLTINLATDTLASFVLSRRPIGKTPEG